MKRIEYLTALAAMILLPFMVQGEVKKIDGVYYEFTQWHSPAYGAVFDVINVIAAPQDDPYRGEIVLPYSMNNITVSFKPVFDGTMITSLKLVGSFQDLGLFGSNLSFKDCYQLESIEAPELAKISYRAFQNCKSLKEFPISSALKKFEASAFIGCDRLKIFKVSPENGLYTFRDDMLLKNETEMMCHLYSDKSDTYIIPDYVKSIGDDYAFLSNPYLKKIVFPEIIGNVTGFRSCPSLTTVVFPKHIKTIGSYGFWECPITHLEIQNVEAINERAFSDCGQLKLITINSVDSVSPTAFYGCSSLESLVISSNVRYLDGFSYCESLTTITLPYVEMIAPKAFYHSRNLQTLESNGWGTLSKEAFSSSQNISKIIMRCSKPPKLVDDDIYPSNMGFDTKLLKTATVYVPKGSLEAYRNANGWKWFDNIVEGDYEAGVDAVPDNGGIAVAATGDGIEVSGADEEAVAEVYTVSGQLVYRGTERQIPVSKGIYIVRIAGKALKVAVK